MADDTRDIKAETVDAALGEMKLEEGDNSREDTMVQDAKDDEESTSGDVKRSRSGTPAEKSASGSSPKHSSVSQTPKSDYDEGEEGLGGDITVTVEPGKKVAKPSRKSAQKVAPRPPPLYHDLPDSTAEAMAVFQVIPDCLYGSKSMGKSKMSDDDDGPIDCDCSELRINGKNQACGEDSDCINRATKLECVDGDCPCGRGCQNQRFQRKQYANVSVIKTEKKGYGLRADVDLSANDFIFEYIGEVINEPTFRRRTIQYDEEGIKHFYFMSLNKSEFIDATRKGNLGRFCNHSCNPNCYVDKWVVGEKLRMGIFAERNIKAGEELVFNYNVDRYGADPQRCYCGEPNCSGYIGGKTQSGRATKLSHGTIEALGIDDGDGWDSPVAKKPRKKKAGEDDEEYVNNLQPRSLDEEGVRKVMATLMQCKEKWIAVKLLNRIQRCDDDRVRNRVVQMHGYQILRSTLSTWKDDDNVILQVLDILYKFPRLTRNKISDSKIETSIQALVTREHEDVAFEAKRLLEEWSKLEVAYRIPRKKFDPSTVPVFERRNNDRVEETPKSVASPVAVAPTGPRGIHPQRSGNFTPSRPPIRRAFNTLPAGWFTAMDEKGNSYYYSKSGQTTWQRPTFPAPEPPPPPKAPPKSVQTARALQDIIDSITKAEPTPQVPVSSTPPPKSVPKEKKKPSEKWRSLPLEKQKKLYENTLVSHTKSTMQRFAKKLPKEDLKKFGREINKILVASDYKHNRVQDPTKISKSQADKAKHMVRQFLEKAVEKKKVIDRQKREKEARKAALNGAARPEANSKAPEEEIEVKDESEGEPDVDPDADDDADLIELTPSSPAPDTPSATESSDLKRKREDGEETPGDESESSKRVKGEDLSPPPPPPPPPAGLMPEDNVDLENEEMDGMGEVVVRETREEMERREQEEELMRENEEAMLMDMDGTLQSAEEAKQLHQNGHLNGRENGDGHSHGLDLDTTPEPNPSRKVRVE